MALRHRCPGLSHCYATRLFGGLLAVCSSFCTLLARKPRKAERLPRTTPMMEGSGVTVAMATLFFIYVLHETSLRVLGLSESRARLHRQRNQRTYDLAPMFFYSTPGLQQDAVWLPWLCFCLPKRLSPSRRSFLTASNDRTSFSPPRKVP